VPLAKPLPTTLIAVAALMLLLGVLAAQWLPWLLPYWLQAALQHPAALQAAVRAQALYGAGALAFNQADFAQAEALATQSLEIWVRLGDTAGIATCLVCLGSAAWAVGETARATTLYERSLVL